MTRYVICLDNEEHLVHLEVRKVYQVVDDPEAEAAGAIRIIDETGEDYLFEAARFAPVELSEAAQAAFEPVTA
jgi:hypothetical protein